MKYIIVVNDKLKNNDVHPRMPIIFPDWLCHIDMVPKGHTAISAGFFDIKNSKCFGESETLKLKADEKKDSLLLETWLLLGESCLMMASVEHAYKEEE